MPGTDPDSAERPFQTDAQAKQQLAIALSGADDIAGAVALLDSLDPQVKNDPETKGILAGRFKRQWRKSRKIPIGYRAYRIYREGLDIARDDKNWNQVFYNGINTAFMSFAMGESDYAKYANEVLEAYASWTRTKTWRIRPTGPRRVARRHTCCFLPV